MNRRSITIALIAVAVVGGVVILTSRESNAKKNLDALLHGSQAPILSRVVVEGFRSGTPVRAEFTDQIDLNYLTQSFRKAEDNVSNAGYFFTGSIRFAGDGSARIYLSFNEGLDYLVLSKPTFMALQDPLSFRIPLEHPLPTNIEVQLNRLLPENKKVVPGVSQ